MSFNNTGHFIKALKIIVLKTIKHRPSGEVYLYVWTDGSLIYISWGGDTLGDSIPVWRTET